MTLSNAPAVDKCRCPIAKADYEVEGELGTTVTCPDCHLEEVTTQKPDDTEQPDVKQASLPDEQRVYIAFKGSTSLKKIANRNPSDQSIISAIKKRKKTQQPVRKLINEYGIPTLVTSLRFLIDQEIFASMDAARCRFPDLFLEEQASPRPEEEQETATGHLPTKEIEPLDGEYAVKPLRGRIDEVLLMANRDAASIHNEADRKVADIEAQREKLNQEEEDVKRHQSESLKNIRDSIERDIFAAMGQAKDVLPDIGLAENRVTS
ncbi:hypothetical protein FSST1_013016 [Fusarium sambucinum]